MVLVVNVASECGLTNSNYTQLKEVLEKYRDKGLRIAAFPCNQFGGQVYYFCVNFRSDKAICHRRIGKMRGSTMFCLSTKRVEVMWLFHKYSEASDVGSEGAGGAPPHNEKNEKIFLMVPLCFWPKFFKNLNDFLL